MNKTDRAKRDSGLDLAKAVAILGVIIIHTCTYNDPVGSFRWLSSVFWGTLARPAVPIFLMCSGALMLRPEKELPLRRLFLHNLLRLIVAMLVWASLYKLYDLIIKGALSPAALWQALKEVLTFQQEFHFYYLHMMLLIYLFLPILRGYVANATQDQLRYALGFWFAFGILYSTLLSYWPFTLLSGFPLQYQINMTYAAIGYGLLGWYLRKWPLKQWISWVLLAVGMLLIFCGTTLFSLRQGWLEERFLAGMRLSACLMATGAFGLLCMAGDQLHGRGVEFAEFLSKGSFCVYLVHIFFLYESRRHGWTLSMLPPLLSIPVLAVGNLACSLTVYWILSKIPGARRWLI